MSTVVGDCETSNVTKVRFQQRIPVSMLCDVSCDDDKMQNVGTVAVGVLACWPYLSPVSTFRCMFGHLVSPSPSPQHQPPEDGKCRKKPPSVSCSLHLQPACCACISCLCPAASHVKGWAPGAGQVTTMDNFSQS